MHIDWWSLALGNWPVTVGFLLAQGRGYGRRIRCGGGVGD